MLLKTLLSKRTYSVYLPNAHHQTKRPKNSRGSSRSKANEIDQMGAWNTRLNFPLSEEQSIRRGTLIPVLNKHQIGICSNVGRRSYQEDRYSICEPLSDLLALAVWDGHGGDACSKFCSEQFERFLQHNLNMIQKSNGDKKENEQKDEDLEEVLKKTLVDLDAAFSRHWKPKDGENTSPGTTATVALIRGGYELVTGHIGTFLN